MKNIVIISILIMLFPNISLAQTIEPHTEAAKCSGVFFVLTSISEKEPLLGTYFENHKIFSDDLMLLLYLNKTKKQMVKDEVKLLQQFGIKIVEEFYTSSPKYIPQKVSDCIAWNYSIRKTIGTDQIDMSLDSRTIPKYKDFAIYPHDNFEGLIPYVYEAFHIWNSKGKPSPSTLENMLTFDKLEPEEQFNPLAAMLAGELGGVLSPFEQAKTDCGNMHYMPGYGLSNKINDIEILNTYSIQHESIMLGFTEATEEYANCVLNIMDHYIPENVINHNLDTVTIYIPSKKLRDSFINCLDIGYMANSPEYGRCVLKLLN